MPDNSYESISIDKRLVKDVGKYILDFHGYRSTTEFIHEAIRLRLLELDKIRIEKLRLEADSARKSISSFTVTTKNGESSLEQKICPLKPFRLVAVNAGVSVWPTEGPDL